MRLRLPEWLLFEWVTRDTVFAFDTCREREHSNPVGMPEYCAKSTERPLH